MENYYIDFTGDITVVAPNYDEAYAKVVKIVEENYDGVCNVVNYKTYGNKFFFSFDAYANIDVECEADIERVFEDNLDERFNSTVVTAIELNTDDPSEGY